MQLPPVDRQASASTGAEAALGAVGRVVPVAPVNPAAPPQPEPTAGVVNRIGGAAAADASASATYRNLAESHQRPAEQATAPQDWTIQRAKDEKKEEPPPEPISKVLLDFLQAVWRASAGAVEIAQIQNQHLSAAQNNTASAQSQAAKEAVTYSPTKVRRNEKL